MHGAVDWVSSQQKMDNFVKTKILPEMFECDIGKILNIRNTIYEKLYSESPNSKVRYFRGK